MTALFHCEGFEPVEADNAHGAARAFAERLARANYGESGMATWIAETNKPGVFRCFVGAYEQFGRTRGLTIVLPLIEQRS
jgi:hypothetical protein